MHSIEPQTPVSMQRGVTRVWCAAFGSHSPALTHPRMQCCGWEPHTNKRERTQAEIDNAKRMKLQPHQMEWGGEVVEQQRAPAATSRRRCHAWRGWRLVSAMSVTIPPKHPEKMWDIKLNEACATSGTSILSGKTSLAKRSICKISSASNPSRIIATRFTNLRKTSRVVVTINLATTVDTLGLNKKPKVPKITSHLTQKKRCHNHLKVFPIHTKSQCWLFAFSSVGALGTTGAHAAGSPASDSLKIQWARANLTKAASPVYLLAIFCKRSGLILSNVAPFKGPSATTVLPCLATKVCIARTPNHNCRALQFLLLGQRRQQNTKLRMRLSYPGI